MWWKMLRRMSMSEHLQLRLHCSNHKCSIDNIYCNSATKCWYCNWPAYTQWASFGWWLLFEQMDSTKCIKSFLLSWSYCSLLLRKCKSYSQVILIEWKVAGLSWLSGRCMKVAGYKTKVGGQTLGKAVYVTRWPFTFFRPSTIAYSWEVTHFSAVQFSFGSFIWPYHFRAIRWVINTALTFAKLRHLPNMHMPQFKMETNVIVVICLQRKKNMQNAEYHVLVLLGNIVVEQQTKLVGSWPETVLKVSL